MTGQRIVLAAAAAASLLCMSGCLISSSSKNYERGTLITRASLASLEPGVADRAAVVAALGEPKSRQDLGEGAELWKWEYTKRRKSAGSVLFLFASASESETHTSTYVLLRDGIVERAWQD